jgi:hypothetical protein
MELHRPSQIRIMSSDQPDQGLLAGMLRCLEGPDATKCPFVAPGLDADSIFFALEATNQAAELEESLLDVLPTFLILGPRRDTYKAMVIGLPNFDDPDALEAVCVQAAKRGYKDHGLSIGTFTSMVSAVASDGVTECLKPLPTIIIRPDITTDPNMSSRLLALQALEDLAALAQLMIFADRVSELADFFDLPDED